MDIIEIEIREDGTFKITGLDAGSKQVHEIENKLASLMGSVKKSKIIKQPTETRVVRITQ